MDAPNADLPDPRGVGLSGRSAAIWADEGRTDSGGPAEHRPTGHHQPGAGVAHVRDLGAQRAEAILRRPGVMCLSRHPLMLAYTTPLEPAVAEVRSIR